MIIAIPMVASARESDCVGEQAPLFVVVTNYGESGCKRVCPFKARNRLQRIEFEGERSLWLTTESQIWESARVYSELVTDYKELDLREYESIWSLQPTIGSQVWGKAQVYLELLTDYRELGLREAWVRLELMTD